MHSISPCQGPDSSTLGAFPVQAQHEDEVTVEDLLYDAQMAMIAHQHDRAIRKLEQAVEYGSSAACATLANLYSKGYCRSEQPHPVASVSPTATALTSSSVSPPPARPRMPNRSTSWNCHDEHQGHRSAESLKAAELYLKGLEIEVEKPVQPAGRRGRSTDESSSEDERAEGRYWTLQSTLDLVVGLTDAHRFGVLQPPSITVQSVPDNPLDSLWNRSSRVSSRILSHSTIAPFLAALSSESSLPASPATSTSTIVASATPTLLNATSSGPSARRTQSISRSYTHPAASIPDPGASQQNRKLQVTIAVHALYILALQAFSSPSRPVPVPDLPTPDASPVMIDETPIASSPTSLESSPSTISGLVCPGGSATAEYGEQSSSSLFDLILLLAVKFSNSANSSIGIKEGDELVKRAQRRLDAMRNVERPGDQDWRLAKKKKRQAPIPVVEKNAGLSIPSQDRIGVDSGHAKNSSDGTMSSSMTITPGSFNRRSSKFHFADEDGEVAGATQQAYPSPPDTPPAAEEDSSVNRRLAPLDTTIVRGSSSASPSTTSQEPLRSPPLASPLQPRYRSLHSQSSTHLTRPRRDSLSSFRSHAPPGLPHFSDPSKRLLRRVESSTSVCTVPPDFGATRLKAGDKGKGKAYVDDPNDLAFGSRYGTGEMTYSAATARLGVTTRGGDEDRKVGKSWLSRFFSVSGLNPVREATSRSKSDVAERLKEALKKDDEASTSVEYIMDWGDEDVPTEDEDEDEDEEAGHLVHHGESLNAERHQNRDTDTALVQASASVSPASPTVRQPNFPRKQSSKASLHSKRSFMLNDPTTSSSSDSYLSPASPHQLASNTSTSLSTRRNRHRRHPSSSSSSNFLSPLSAANPPSSSTKIPNRDRSAAVSIDPLLLELERRSRVGVRTVCQNCHKKGLNYPACRTCGKCYCSRMCRVGEAHECVQ